MSINLNSLTGDVTTTGTYITDNNIWADSGTHVYYPPIMSKVFENMSKTFNLELEQGQIDFLDQLYDSSDEQNRILACEMFKSILNKQLK